MSLAIGTLLRAEVPQMISYQGRLTVGNQNFKCWSRNDFTGLSITAFQTRLRR
jgi:hypothetical protein